MRTFLATFTNRRGESKQLRVTAIDLTSAKQTLRRRGILADSIISEQDQSPVTFIAAYRGKNLARKIIEISAEDIIDAKRKFRRMGITSKFIITPDRTTRWYRYNRQQENIPTQPKFGLFSDGFRSTFEAKPGVRDKAIFANKQAALVDAGVPIVRGLSLMASQQKKPLFRRALNAISGEISQGESLANAMRKWPKVFDRLSIAMIEAGEMGGVLDQSLKRLAKLLEQNAKLQNQIRGALSYPIIVFVIALAVFLGMTIFLIPTFAEIFEQLGAELPAFTQFMVDLSKLLRSPFSLFLLGGILLGSWLFINFYRTPYGHRKVDGALLKLPIFGDLVQKSATAQFSRTFSSLTSAGVPILMALDVVRETSTNILFADAINACRDDIQEGIPLSIALDKKNVFPEMAISMLAIGEETGEMDQMLSKVADFYEDEVETTVKALTALIEPIMIVVVGIMVGAILVAMYLPMFSIFENIR